MHRHSICQSVALQLGLHQATALSISCTGSTGNTPGHLRGSSWHVLLRALRQINRSFGLDHCIVYARACLLATQGRHHHHCEEWCCNVNNVQLAHVQRGWQACVHAPVRSTRLWQAERRVPAYLIAKQLHRWREGQRRAHSLPSWSLCTRTWTPA